MSNETDAPEAARLAGALLECTAPVTQILDHMARAPDAPDLDAALRTLRVLLESALASLEDRVPSGDLRRAAEIVDLATDAILAEILMVPHANAPSCRTGPRRRRGSRRGP
jgi:hypothetical protein